MRRLLGKCFSTKRATAVSVAIVALLVFASVGLAAWFIYSGANGSASGKFYTTQNGGSAILLSDGVPGGSGQLAPGQSGSLFADVINNDALNAHTIASLSSTSVDTVPAECAAHLTFNGAAFVGLLVPAGATLTNHEFVNAVSADVSTPLTCSGASIKYFVLGTSTP